MLAPLHFLKEAVLKHLLLQLLEGGLNLVVENLDLHGNLRCRVERWGWYGTEWSTTSISLMRLDPCSRAPAIVGKVSRDSSTSSPA